MVGSRLDAEFLHPRPPPFPCHLIDRASILKSRGHGGVKKKNEERRYKGRPLLEEGIENTKTRSTSHHSHDGILKREGGTRKDV